MANIYNRIFCIVEGTYFVLNSEYLCNEIMTENQVHFLKTESTFQRNVFLVIAQKHETYFVSIRIYRGDKIDYNEICDK